MNNKSFAVAKINFQNLKLAFMITGISMGLLAAQDIVYMVLSFFDLHPGLQSSTVALGNYLYLIIILGAIFIPALNFRKMMNLGGKRSDFFKGCILNYLIMSAVVSLAAIILCFTYERFTVQYYAGHLNILYVFGWIDNGVLIAFFQQFAFLFLLASFTHTLTAIQDKWYGWVTDAVLVAIISVFTPIAPLRKALIWFFDHIIFQSNAFLQIISCLILAVVIYSVNLPVLARKNI